MKTSREEVYKVIDGERNYQDSLFVSGGRFSIDEDGEDPSRAHTVGESILILKRYVDKAAIEWNDNCGNTPALHMIRKVAGIAVRCMEEHGAPKRQLN